MLFICTLNEDDIDAEDVLICPITLSDWTQIAELRWRGKKDGVAVYQPYFKIVSGVSFAYDGMANGVKEFVSFMHPAPGGPTVVEEGRALFLTDSDSSPYEPNPAFSLDANNKSLRLNNLNIWRADFVGIGADFRAAMNVLPDGRRKVTIQIAYDDLD